VLEGSEVKALREGKANITESYAAVENGELWLINAYIPRFSHAQADVFGHDERRRRKLLVRKGELAKLYQATGRQGMTLVPMQLYFNERGIAKAEIGVAKGKKAPDKRATEAKRDWARDKARLLRDRG
jgi:SsrA-binding protein